MKCYLWLIISPNSVIFNIKITVLGYFQGGCMYSPENLANNIRELAKKNKISQKDLLLKCDLGVNTITRLSNGTDILTKNLVKFADELNCSIDYLVGRSNQIKISQSNFSPDELLFIEKFRSISKESQDEITHILNYKYEQYQKKRKRLSSNSGAETDDGFHNMLA